MKSKLAYFIIATASIAVGLAFGAEPSSLRPTGNVTYAASQVEDAFNRINWMRIDANTIDAAFALARRQEKLIFLLSGSEASPELQALKATVFARSDVAERLGHYICLYLEQESIGAGKMADDLGVGFPRNLMAVFTCNREQVMRIPNELDCTRYDEVLALCLRPGKPAKALLTELRNGNTRLTKDEYQRLAYHDWYSTGEIWDSEIKDQRSFALAMSAAAKQCPDELKVEQARMTITATVIGVNAYYSETIHGGASSFTVEVAALVKELFSLLGDRANATAAADCLQRITLITPAVACDHASIDMKEFFGRLFDVFEGAAGDDHYPAAQIHFLGTEMTLMGPKWGQYVDLPKRTSAIRDRMEKVFDRVREPHLRGAMVQDAQEVFKFLKEPEKGRALLEAELPATITPSMTMLLIGSLDGKLGKPDSELEWRKRAYDAAVGPITRFWLGQMYTMGLMQYRAADSQTIRKVALAVLDELRGDQDLQGVVTRKRFEILSAALRRWKAKGGDADAYRVVQARADQFRTSNRQVALAEMKSSGVSDPGDDPDVLNQFGYRLLYEENDIAKALKCFGWNLTLFPEFDVHTRDSLAEGYLQAGRVQEALDNYRSVVFSKPTFPTAAKEIVEKLSADRSNLPSLQRQLHDAYFTDKAEREAQKRRQDESRNRHLEMMKTPVEMKFTTIDGRTVDVSRLRGNVVLIDFWATWCGPCVKEIPNVVATYEKYHDKGFEIVGITLDKDSKPAAEILEFTKKNQMPWPQCFDVKRGDQAFAKQFGIEAIPTMFLLDQNGMIVSTNARGPKLEEEIKKLLGL